MKETLSIQQARKLVLLSQKLLPQKQSGSATTATLSAIEHLGYIQIDAISVVQRAHHHTLWNRNPRYTASQLDTLLDDKQVFEYWSHAAAYLPMRDYRFSLIRKQALASGKQKHWHKRDDRTMRWVLDRITAEGPLMAKDFEHQGEKVGEWRAKPAKQALEYLFMQGDLMIPRRNNFHKVYDLTQRVLPGDVDATTPTAEEHSRYLITRFLQANGLGQAAEIAYLRKGHKPLIRTVLQDMVAAGEVQEVRVADHLYYTIPSALELVGKPLPRNRARILSPFDNLVIQRKRMSDLFAFDYLIECYVPQPKRKYGYFCLPILWDGKFVGRMDSKVERKESRLHIHHFALEPEVTETDAIFAALSKELKSFLRFNDCDQVQLHKTSPAKLKPKFKSMLSELST